jgi:hypothetical protein
MNNIGKIFRLRIFSLFILIVIFFSFCQSCNRIDASPTPITIEPTTGPGTTSPNLQLTVAAYETQISGLTLTAQFTPLPSKTATPTVTPIPPTKVPTSTATPFVRNCNWAEFVRDITIPDGTEIEGGAAFTKTWRLRNVGECTWTLDYNIVFVGGESFSAPVRIGMPRVVAPGETVDISLLLEAPTYPGSYPGYFMLSDGQGDRFGAGVNADQQFWVSIVVRSPDDVVFSFIDSYCRANWWSSVDDSLPCPGDELSDNSGFVVRKENPIREDGAVENEPGLITSPDSSDYGYIYGIYPNLLIQKGDIFKSLIGCSYDSPGCNLTFELRYQIEGGAMRTIKSWTEIYDGIYHSIIADLSDLAGFNVNLILFVENNGSTENNRGMWIAPRIMR